MADCVLMRLSVGGTLFTTTRATLCAEKGSMLATKFEGGSPFGELVADETGAIFLDTDPATFTWILGYLRRSCCLAGTPPQPLLEQVRADADYFGLSGLVKALDARLAAIEMAEKAEKAEKAKKAATRYTYQHRLVGPLSATATDGDEDRRYAMFEQSMQQLNDSAQAGYRLVSAAVDGEGNYVDCMMEKVAAR